MKDDLNIAAFTPTWPGNYPPYVSINQRAGEMHIAVRGNPSESGECGQQATIVMSPRQFYELFQSVHDAYRLGKITGNDEDRH